MGRRAAPRGSRLATSVWLAAAGLATAGCVGAVDRSDFEAEIEARGGGFDQSLVIDALDRVAEEVGSDDFDIASLTVSPLGATMSVRVRDPRAPQQLDDYAFRGDELTDVRPVRVSAGDDLDATTVPIGDFAVDRLNAMVDDALDAYDTSGGFATTVRLAPDLAGGVGGRPTGVVSVDLESPRSAATATFTADGDLLELDPR